MTIVIPDFTRFLSLNVQIFENRFQIWISRDRFRGPVEKPWKINTVILRTQVQKSHSSPVRTLQFMGAGMVFFYLALL